MRIVAYSCLLALILLSLFQIAFHVSRLPDRVATHFNGAGQPDGFTTKSRQAWLMLGLMLGMPAMTAGMGVLIKQMPAGMINIPNRDYWLAPERREATLRHVEISLVWIAVVTQVLLLALNQLTYWANVKQVGLDMTAFGWLMFGFLAAVGGICGQLLWRYRLPGTKPGSQDG